ncbi:hypothetical protein [Methylobacterium sp. Leaf113]|uniref:hypothetical protein n=1 Tax=Methylobacterium sp. Leaf113 TaxID=1736259 RepID=UPI000AA859B3|nr:hypothetical protein [Methylobacterium sp. Leaf113]
MIVGFIPVALLGALGGSALMWSHGLLEAVIAAPLGGSLAVLGAAAVTLARGALDAGPRHSARVNAHFLSTWRASAHV